jgi:hypothetical protein
MHLLHAAVCGYQHLLHDSCAGVGGIAPWCNCAACNSTSTVPRGLGAVASLGSCTRRGLDLYDASAVRLFLSPVCVRPRLGPVVQVGEHESCGPGNMPVSGFTYNPETFMAAKIGVYNISWRDMGVPTLEKMMDIVQVGYSEGSWGASSCCWLCSACRSTATSAPGSRARQLQQWTCPNAAD